MEYVGGAAGATLGYIMNDVKGAYAGYKFGRRYGKKFTNNNSTMDSGYGSGKRSGSSTKRASKRAKVGYTFVGGKQTGRMSRAAFLKRLGPKKTNRRSVTKRGGKRRSVKKGTKVSLGPYSGSFRKPRRVKRSMMSKCLAQGYAKNIEQYGRVSDSDCVFVGQSTAYINEVARVACNAIIRKLMTKAGFKINNQLFEVSATGPLAGIDQEQESIGLRFAYYTRDAVTGSYTTVLYDTVAEQNFIDICRGFSAFSNQVINYLRAITVLEPWKIAVYRRNQNAQWFVHAAEIWLTDSHLDIFMESSMTIQNRTLAAAVLDTNNVETNRVDSQPLKGWIYEFKHADPRVKNPGPPTSLVNPEDSNLDYDNIQDIGLFLRNGANFSNPLGTDPGVTENVGSTEPMVPQYFANIAKATPVTLQPGEIKKLTFFYKFSGKITNLLKSMRATNWSVSLGLGYVSGMKGKCQVIALEEMMRTSSTNKVEVAYERELKIGAIAKIGLSSAVLEAPVVYAQYDSLL